MSSDDEAPQSKKMHSGYHGWMKTIPKTSQDFTPVRIENAAATTATNTTSGNSAWNAAGTWEEKDKSEWARERLKHHILTSFIFENEHRKVAIKAKSIVRCDGDAKIVFSRGRKRCGYDISLKFEWESTRLDGQEDPEGIEQATGHVEIHDFDDTNGEDYEVNITTENQSQHEQDAKKAIVAYENDLRKILAVWKDELLQQ